MNSKHWETPGLNVYTQQQLDAAVAAQRERCVAAIEALAEGWGDQAEEYGMRLAASEARKA